MKQRNEVRKIYKNMKMSTYNITVYDQEGNLIIYNFLTGIPSTIKIMKPDIEKFRKIFSESHIIHDHDCESNAELVKKLLRLGILVDADLDEELVYYAKTFEETYENKLFLTILPTGKCNFNCSYCLESEQNFLRDRMNEQSQNAVLKFVQKNISKYHELRVVWFGGEPLLEASIIEDLSKKLILICNSRHIIYSASTTTNGYLLNPEVFEKLYNQKLYNFMITVDGFKEQHDKFRCMHNGDGTYDKIMKNLLYIRDNKQYRFVHITIRVNVTRDVLNVIDELIARLDADFANDPRFSFMFIPVNNYSSTKETDETVFIKNEELDDKLNNNELYIKKYKSKELNTYLISPNHVCNSALRESFVISPDLKVYKCCAHYDMKENYLGYIDLDGNLIVDEALHRKWYLINEAVRRKFDSCKNCFYKPACLNNGKNCPYKYLKEDTTVKCPLEIEGFTKKLSEDILESAKKNCYVVTV